MRIVFSNYDDRSNPYYGGGGARAIHEVARRLAVRHPVQVVTGNYPGAKDETADGVQYRRLGKPKSGPKFGQLLFQFRLPGQVRRGGFDIWVESLTPPFSTAFLPRFTSQPVVALTQVLAGRAMSRKYRLPFGWVERQGLKCYRHAIALSTSIDAELKRANPRLRTAIIPNGVPGELIRMAVQRGDAHGLFLGRLDVHQKGLDLLLDAWARVGRQMHQPLLIAGAGTPRDESYLRGRITQDRLADQVQLLGRVDGATKHDLLRRAAFVVMPSRYEASPLVLVEAFCYGLPVVVFDIPDLRDIPPDVCVKVPAFRVDLLGEAVLVLAKDPEPRAVIGCLAKQFTRRFDWDALAWQYEDFLQEVASQPAGRLT